MRVLILGEGPPASKKKKKKKKKQLTRFVQPLRAIVRRDDNKTEKVSHIQKNNKIKRILS